MDAEDLIPSPELLFDGSTTAAEFKAVGEGFTWALLIGRGRLQPHERVLDLGCGIGQKARVLATYLKGGTYEGLDVVPKGIDWCRERYRRFGNFRFQVADIYSSHYNPGGRFKDVEYVLPYPDGDFDMVFLSSVFTHMLPEGVAHYLSEIARVLKPGGRCIATYFLLNAQPQRQPPWTGAVVQFPYEFKGFRVRNADNPSEAVAHHEETIRAVHAKSGLRVVEITYGFWCGGKELLGALQDSIIAVRN